MKPVFLPMKFLRLTLLWWLCGAVALSAQVASMSALQNLPAVGVKVRDLSVDGAKFGLTETALLATVRGVLEPAGVRVVPPPMLERAPDTPTLEISANLSKTTKTGYFFILDLQLWEPGKPVRKLETLATIPVVTWAQQKGGFTAKPEAVNAALAKLAEAFVAEWRTAQGRAKP